MYYDIILWEAVWTFSNTDNVFLFENVSYEKWKQVE